MKNIHRRHVLTSIGVGGTLAGGYILCRGASNASFSDWDPMLDTWPLQRYDTSNTAYNPHANPPRSKPTKQKLADISSDGQSNLKTPLISSNHIAVFGPSLTILSRDDNSVVYKDNRESPAAGFGPTRDAHLYFARSNRQPGNNGLDIVDLKIEDGRIEQSSQSFDVGPISGLIVGANELYFGTPSREINGVSHGDSRVWRVDGKMPAVSSNQMYAVGAPNGVVSYQKQFGISRWVEVGPKRQWTGDWLEGQVHRPAVGNNQLLVGTRHVGVEPGRGTITAYNIDDGSQQWQQQFSGIDASTPAISGSHGFTTIGKEGSSNNEVIALELRKGNKIWEDTVDWKLSSSPVVGGDTFLVTGLALDNGIVSSKMVRAYDITSGEKLWTVSFDGGNPSSVAVAGNEIFVTADSSLYSIS